MGLDWSKWKKSSIRGAEHPWPICAVHLFLCSFCFQCAQRILQQDPINCHRNDALSRAFKCLGSPIISRRKLVAKIIDCADILDYYTLLHLYYLHKNIYSSFRSLIQRHTIHVYAFPALVRSWKTGLRCVCDLFNARAVVNNGEHSGAVVVIVGRQANYWGLPIYGHIRC